LGIIHTLLQSICLTICAVSVFAQQPKRDFIPDVNNPQNDFQSRVAPRINMMDWRGAVNELDEIIGRDSSNVTAYMLRATMYTKLYNYALAIRDYDKAISLQPKNQEAYVERAMLKGEIQDDYAGAAEDFTTLLKLDPNNDTFWFYRGMNYERLQRYDDAMSDYSMSMMKSGTTNSVTLVRRGVCAMNLKRDEPAVKDFSAALKAAPTFDPFFYRASIYLKQRKYRESIADFDAALRIDNQSARAYYMRGYAKLGVGQPQDACIDLAQAREFKFEPAQKLIEEYCEGMPNLDSLRRFKMQEVYVTAARSPQEIAIRDSRTMLNRVASLVANPMMQAPTSIMGTPQRLLPPGQLNPMDCNKMQIQMRRPSEISVYCVVQILQDDLKNVKDATVQSLMRDAFATAQDLYVVESSSQTGGSVDASQSQNLRLRLSQQLRELNDFLERMERR
jgi:tetratricopeptide (TPR) repeat protein